MYFDFLFLQQYLRCNKMKHEKGKIVSIGRSRRRSQQWDLRKLPKYPR